MLTIWLALWFVTFGVAWMVCDLRVRKLDRTEVYYLSLDNTDTDLIMGMLLSNITQFLKLSDANYATSLSFRSMHCITLLWFIIHSLCIGLLWIILNDLRSKELNFQNCSEQSHKQKAQLSWIRLSEIWRSKYSRIGIFSIF